MRAGSFIIKGDTICVLGSATVESGQQTKAIVDPRAAAATLPRPGVVNVDEVYGVFADLYTPLTHRRMFPEPQLRPDIGQISTPIMYPVQNQSSTLKLLTLEYASSVAPAIPMANYAQTNANVVESISSMQSAPLPPSDDGLHFKRHASTPKHVPATTSSAYQGQAAFQQRDGSSALDTMPQENPQNRFQGDSLIVMTPSHREVAVENPVQGSQSTTSQNQLPSYEMLHLMHMMSLQNAATAPSSEWQTKSADNISEPQFKKTSNTDPPKHTSIWTSRKTRNAYLIFLFMFLLWCALDVFFDVFFAIESYRIIISDISSSPFMMGFFPATVVFLVISFCITIYSNFGYFRRLVVVSSHEHSLESKVKTCLIWQELFPSIVILFRAIMFTSVSSARRSMIASSISIYEWYFGKPIYLHPQHFFLRPPTSPSTFLKIGLRNIATSIFYLPRTIPATLHSMACLFSISVTEQRSWYDICDSGTLFPKVLSFLNESIVKSCASGVTVEFCDSTASSDSGYLMFLSTHVVRPIGACFNFKTRINPEGDINVVDPLDSGYFERLTKWWNNYEEWQGSTMISYIMFVPFCFLAVLLLLLQITSSLIMTTFHVTAMLLQLICFPVLFMLGYPSGVFMSFCKSVKFMTGAIFIFSPKMPNYVFHSENINLQVYSPYCRGVSNLHELHLSAFQIGNIPYRFKIAVLILGAALYLIRFIVLKPTSFVICALSWVFVFLFKICLGVIQVIACIVSAILSILSFILLVVATITYIILSPFLFLFAFILLILWFFVSILALCGMELLCFASAITNPEAGLILFDNVTEKRYRLSLFAGCMEAIPCLIIQAYYTSLVGTQGTAGTFRISSLAFSSWRICFLLARLVSMMMKFACDRKWSSITPNNFWSAQKESFPIHHAVTANILINFRSSLFPDRLSAALRIFIFGMIAAFFIWLGYLNLYNTQSLSDFMQSNFPAPVICDSPNSFVVCDVNARCVGDECVCNTGYGGNGKKCIESRPGLCADAAPPCGYASTCVDTPGGYTCPCPSWTTAPLKGSAFYGFGNLSSQMCVCDSLSFPNLNIGKGACVTTSDLTQGEVAAIMIFAGYIPLVLIFFAHWLWNTRGGVKYPAHWKVIFRCLLLVLVSISVGLYLGGTTSMMLLVICVPILLIFLAHWNWKTRDGSKYPKKWKILFAIVFISLICLGLGLMLGNTVNTNIDKIRNQAAIMIFAVCVPILLSFLLYWQYTTRAGAKVLSKKEKRRRIILLLIVFIAMFALILGCILGISSQPTLQAFDISASDRKAGKIGASVVLAFTPVNTVPSGGTITLRYPPAFFNSGVTPVLTAGSSTVGSLTGTCGATTEKYVVITTAGATIPAGPVVVTVRGFIMGGLTLGAPDVSIQTSADTAMSFFIHSGAILPPITDVFFNILSVDRVSGKSGVKVTLAFTPANPIPSGGTITLYFPPMFFATSITPIVSTGSSLIPDLSGYCGSTTTTSVIITTIGASISPAPFKVTIEGMTMGSTTSGSAVKIATSSDILPSSEVLSGGIFTQVTTMNVAISSSDRIAGRPAVPVTVSFTPTTPVAAGGTITLNYPVGFFAALVTPNITAGKSTTAGLTGVCGPTTASSVVITTAGAVINSSSFVVTITGFVMGAVTAAGGVATVQTSVDVLPSVPVAIGAIKGQVSGVNFGIASSQRTDGSVNVPVTLSFTPATRIPIGGTITLTYPSGFFAPSITPQVLAGSSSVQGLTGTCTNTSSPFIIITTSGAQIPAALFIVTITGFKMGSVTAGSFCTVQTSQDVLPSTPVDSGFILGASSFFMTSPSFSVGSADRIAGRSNVSITIGFTPTTSLPPSSTITVRYPSDFFAASVTPTLVSSSGVGITATFGPTTATHFVITTAGATIQTIAFTVTIGGLTLGGVTPGAVGVTFESSTDTVPTAAVQSGPILGQIANVDFSIRLQNRLVGGTAVPVTISFVSASSLPVGGTMTLSYPLGFFSPSIVPSIPVGGSSVHSMSAFCSSTTVTHVIITIAGVPMPASAVTLTISGFTMGSATSGGVVYLESSADTVPSLPVLSGAIYGQVQATTFVIATSDRIAGRAQVPITIGFSPSTPLGSGGTITLTYPLSFFASCTPSVGATASSIPGLTLTSSATTTTSFVLTTAGVTISPGASVTLTISGLTMGGATSGSVGVYMQTSTDTLPSVAIASGAISTRVTFVSMSISASDRIAIRSSVPVTIGFAATNPLPVGSSITLNYPSGFFASGVAVAFNSSSVAGLTGVCSVTTATQIVITTGGATIPNSAIVITISGFTMGLVTSGSVGVTIHTSTDPAASEAVSSGSIVGQVSDVSFEIQSSDRIARRASVSITIGFKFVTAIPVGGTITLKYPAGFFASLVTPSAITAGTSSVPQLTGTCSATTADSVVITTASTPISVDTLITGVGFFVTIAGFQMGAVAASTLGVNVRTSSDTEPSANILSGAILGQVADLSFSISSSHRIASKTNVPITLSFKLSTLVPSGGKITLNYPTSFFGVSTPTVPAGSSSVAGFTGTCAATTSTSVIITTAGAAVPASSFVVTLAGFVMGSATAGAVGVTVQTSEDTAVSAAVSSGSISTQVSTVAFAINVTDRIALKPSVSVTLTFTPATSLPPGGTITLTYPDGFFVPSITPSSISASSSNVANLVGSCSATTANSVTITTAAASIPAAAPFVVTIR